MIKSTKKKTMTIIASIAAVIAIILGIIIYNSHHIKVDFLVDSESYYTIKNIKKGTTIEVPEDPIKEGYNFEGWYYKNERFDFKEKINHSMKLEAKWSDLTFYVTIDDTVSDKIIKKVKYGETIKTPSTPVKKGYDFVGWYEGDEKYDFEDPIKSDTYIIAKWKKETVKQVTYTEPTTYSVYHYLMKKDGTYDESPDEEETFSSKVGMIVSPKTSNYRGYKSPNVKEIKLSKKDNIVEYYYEILKYKLTLIGDEGIENTTGEGEYFYLDEINISYTLKPGFEFKEYSLSFDKVYIMPDNDVTIYLKTARENHISYTVEHYKMNTDGNYSEIPDEKEVFEGTTGDLLKPETKEYVGFKSPEKIEQTLSGDGTTIIKYYYERNKYNLNVKGDKGIDSVTGEGEYYYEEKVKINAVVKNGYEFNEWSNGEKNINTEIVIGTNDQEITALTKPIIYKIEYDLDGGSVKDNPTEYTIESSEITLNNARKTGYDFIGWSLNNDEAIIDRTIKTGTTGNLKFTAKYEAKDDIPYKVEHYKMGIDGKYLDKPEEIEEKRGTTDSIITPEVKKYIGFTSPKVETVKLEADGSTIVKYYYERNKYQVSVKKDNGIASVTGEGKYYFEEKVTLSATLKPGYEFVSWSNDSTEPRILITIETNDIELITKTKPIIYSISYDLDGGSVSDNPTEYTVETPDITLKNPSKLGYKFLGWSLNNDTPTVNRVIKNGTTGNLKFTAKYQIRDDISYKVEHYKMGLDGKYPTTPSETENLKGIANSNVTPNVKTYTGFTSPKVETIKIEVDGSTVLKYYYERNKYNITAEKDNGIASVTGEGKYYYEENVELIAKLKTGYEFISWSNGDISLSITIKVAANDINLKATSKIIKYSINYDLDGGSVSGNPTEYTVETPDITLKNPTKLGYKFLGWSLNDDVPIVDRVIKTGTTGNLKFTAKYEAKSDIPYKVEHYKMGIDGKYLDIPDEIEEKRGTTDSIITPDVKKYTGFTSPKVETVTINGNGKTVVKYYYERNKYQVSVKKDNGIASVTGEDKYYFEEKVTLSATLKPGYEFVSWSNGNTDLKTSIIVETSDTELATTTKPIVYNISYDLDGGSVSGNPTEYTVETPDITLKNPTKLGYNFIGWLLNDDIPIKNRVIKTGTTGNLKFTAKYQVRDDIPYKVEHYKMNLDGKYPTTPSETENLKGIANSNVTPNVKTYTGFTSPKTEAIKIEIDGSTVLKYYYERNKYDLTVKGDTGIKSTSGTGKYYYEQKVKIGAEIKPGYEFISWSNSTKNINTEITISAENIEISATTKPIVYNISYDLDGGSVNGNPTEYTIETPDITLKNPTKSGYKFLGWSLNGDAPTVDRVIKTGTTGNLKFTAKYQVRDDIPYKVEHYKMGLDGKYPTTPSATESLKGRTDSNVTPKVKTYTGFTSPKTQTVTINGDGSTVVKYYYERNKYNITVTKDNGIASVTGEGLHYYEEKVTLTANLKEGYNFNRWSNGDTNRTTTVTIDIKDITLKATTQTIKYTITYKFNGGHNKENPHYYTIETEDITLKSAEKTGYTFTGWSLNGDTPQINRVIKKGTKGDLVFEAHYTPNSDTPYTVKHYKMGLDGLYNDQPEIETKYGTSGENINPEVKTYVGFISPRPKIDVVRADGSTVVKYYYERLKYQIILTKDNGIDSVTGEGMYYYDSEVTISAKIKTGYEFNKWSNGESATSISVKIEANNINLKATSKIIKYTITYDLDGGSVSGNPTEYTIETPDITLKNPTKSGYKFLGWSLNGDAPTVDRVIKTGTTGNLKFTAKYQVRDDIPYKVEHYKMDTSGKYPTSASEVENLKGTANATVTPKVKTYTGFTSPKTQTVTINGAGSTIVKYYYERNKYQVTVEKDNGIASINGEGTYYYEENAKLIATLKSGYEFNKWSNGESDTSITVKIETNNINLKATSKIIKYTINYDLDGGSVNGNPTEYTIETPNITLKNPTKLGYNFLGWSLNGDAPIVDRVIKTGTTGNLKFTAKYEAKNDIPYKVEHYKMDTKGKYPTSASEVENLKGTTNATVTPKVKTYTGFTSPKTQTVTINGDGKTVVKYYYERNKYQVTVTKDNGIATVTGEGAHYFEEKVTLTATLKPGYEFNKWSNGETSLSTTVTIDTKNVNLSLSTKVIKYSITYTLNGGSVNGNPTEYTVETPDITLKNPTKKGYKFQGWSLNNDTPAVNRVIKKGTTGNLKFTAKFDPITYQIRYNGNGNTSGSMPNSTHKYDEQKALSKNVYVKKAFTVTYDYNFSGTTPKVVDYNYDFKGWGNAPKSGILYKDQSKVLNITDVDGKIIDLYAIWSTYEPHLQSQTVPDRDGYVFAGWSTSKSADNIISASYKPTGNITLYAIWNLAPLFESMTFNIYKDSAGNEAYNLNEVYSKGDNAFYLKLPNTAYIDVNSLGFVLNTPVSFNTSATSSSNYLDITASDPTTLSLAGNTIEVKTTDGGKTWVGAKNNKDLINVTLFFQYIGSKLGGKNLGIAKSLAVTDKGASSPHYVSTRLSLGGNVYLLFSREGTPTVNVTYKTEGRTIYTMKIPKGSTTPKLDYPINGFKFNGWYSDEELKNSYNFNSPIYSNITVYGKYTSNGADISWYNESENSFNICTKQELIGFSALASTGISFSGKTINLTCDIDLENKEWAPIASFSGTLNGNKHKISNLQIINTTGNLGFFNVLKSSAKIENLKFDNVNIMSGSSTQSGVLAAASQGATISKVAVSNFTLRGQNNAGGIVGSVSGSSVINECSTMSGSITVSATDAGGIAAILSGSPTLTHLRSNATVRSNSDAAPDVGGIIGDYNSEVNNLTMRYVLFTGKVIADPWMYSSYGAIYGRIGYGTGNDKFSNDKENNKPNWFYDKDTIGLSSTKPLSRGTGKTTKELKTASTFAGWDTNIWKIKDGSIPSLKW